MTRYEIGCDAPKLNSVLQLCNPEPAGATCYDFQPFSVGLAPPTMKIHEYQAKAILARYGVPVLSPPIPRTIRFAEAPAVGRSILSTGRNTKGAKAYREVAKGILASL